MRIAIVAGEASGDRLAAGLIAGLRERVAGAAFFGMAGPAMRAQGCRADYDIDALSVMGIVEVLRRYPELKRLQQRLTRQLLDERPDLFISVDAPDFTLGIARAMKQAGIPTVHYVSPTVWAWRAGRARTVAASCDMLLSIFPFEAGCYENLPLDYRFVGHYLADEIDTVPDRAAARAELGIAPDATVLALLPGSRQQEHRLHCADFAAAARMVKRRRPDVLVTWSALDERGGSSIADQLDALPGDTAPRIVSGKTRSLLAAADLALVVSGTATLEALLLKCPFVVAYRTSPWTYRIARRWSVPHGGAGMLWRFADTPLGLYSDPRLHRGSGCVGRLESDDRHHHQPTQCNPGTTVGKEYLCRPSRRHYRWRHRPYWPS